MKVHTHPKRKGRPYEALMGSQDHNPLSVTTPRTGMRLVLLAVAPSVHGFCGFRNAVSTVVVPFTLLQSSVAASGISRAVKVSVRGFVTGVLRTDSRR